MAKYTIAYKNDRTVEHDNKTGRLSKGWVRVYGWDSLDMTVRVYNRMVKDGQFNGSILGVFISHENDVMAWFDRTPRLAHDTRDKSDWQFKGLRGLINSRSSSDL
jgi:hypothetical protein